MKNVSADHADTTKKRGHDKETRTSTANVEGFSQIVREQSGKKVLECNNLEILPKEKIPCRCDTRFSNLAIEYLFENKKVRKTSCACSHGAQVESFKQKVSKISCALQTEMNILHDMYEYMSTQSEMSMQIHTDMTKNAD